MPDTPQPTRTGRGVVILFRTVGVILLVVSVIHFYVTPMLMHNLVDAVGAHVDAVSAATLHSSFLLNHLVVGVLLVPVGLCTIFAAPGIARGDRLARAIGWANTLAVLVLPGIIALVMGEREILSGGPFTLAVALVTLAACSLIAGMCVTRGATGP